MALLFQIRQTVAAGFQAFWDRWPRKVAKLEATKAWKQVVTTEDEEPIQKALDWQVPMFEQRQTEHIPHAATWIRGRRWEDEKPTPKTPTPNRPTAPVLKLNTDAWDQQTRTEEAIRLMREEGLTRDEAIRRAFK